MGHLRYLCLLLICLLTACGGSDSVDAGQGLGDRATPPPEEATYIATSVTENGEQRVLVEGTELEIHFDGDRISASAGCNLINGTYSLTDLGILEVSDLFMTERGCDGPRHDQDEFVANFLADGPAFNVVSQDSIQLSTDGVTIELVDEAVANPPLPLLETEWEVTGFFDASVANTFNVAEPATIQFLDESTAVGHDGCADFTIDVDVDEETVRFDGTLDEPAADCEELPYVARVSASIRGEAAYVIEADKLTLTAPNGVGIEFRAR